MQEKALKILKNKKMLYILILIGVLLILFNLFIWLYDEQKIKLSIHKSLKFFKYVSIIVLALYFLIAMYVYLFIPNTFK
jgi:uncharacterized BrkB/YihY/UPF0761 family membrane protein